MNPPDENDRNFEAEALPHLADIFRFARALTHDDSAAEDLTQDTFLIAQRSWNQLTPGAPCRPWLFTICRNRHYRIDARARRVVAVDNPELESLASTALTMQPGFRNFAERLEARELQDAIRNAMERLPEPFRDVAILVDWHDQTYDVAAEILGVPVGTIRSRLFRARRILQQQLIEHARDAGLR